MTKDIPYKVQSSFSKPTASRIQANEPESQIKQNTVYRESLKEIKRQLLDIQSILKSL